MVNMEVTLEDPLLEDKLQNFQQSLDKITKILDSMLSPEQYDKLPVKERVDYDLFMAFTLDTLFWLLLRLRGEDPNKNEIKNQLNRVKEYMVKAKQAHERNTIRPRLDKEVSARFIKHGISHKNNDKEKPPPNKRIKIVNDSDSDS